MATIPDYTEAELDIVRDLTQQRFLTSVELHFADAELNLHQDSSALVECPTLYFQERECNFTIFKTDDSEYRCQFFYGPDEQYGTGQETYDDLAQCVAALLQVQSDHERERQGVTSGVTGAQLH